MPRPDPAQAIAPGHYRTDVAVIGAGVAGLFTAVKLPRDLDVVIVDKGTGGSSGSSPWAQGGMAAAMGEDDSADHHAADTIAASDGLTDPSAVAVLTREAPTRIRELIELGARFDTQDGHLHLAREGGQHVARSVHRADATGAEMVRVLRDAAAPRVTRLAGTAFELARDRDRVTGVWVLGGDGDPVLLEARAVLLATGGCGGLFAATTNPDHATGDGVALAWLAGAAVRDLEFVQFHPTGLAVSGSWRFLLTEALRGAGATLHDDAGERFMATVHPDAELAPRHVVSKALLGVGTGYLDATHLGEDRLREEFPTVLEGVAEHGFDLATERVPVTPAAHYMIGGVRTDLRARTSVTGLYAAGEVASTGVHGANRMAGNSLSEALVFGARAADAIVSDLPEPPATTPDAPNLPSSSVDTPGLRRRLRATMWNGAGPVRDATRLERTITDLGALAAELGGAAASPEHLELSLAAVTARLIATSALLRTESRGGHWREDHPTSDDAWNAVHLERIRPAT
ncbi:MAG: L-aspartate oxidase [Nitriliruptorales bacterium]|nr:L-aspartate oxidase [Nitriliruptorales bacterium]